LLIILPQWTEHLENSQEMLRLYKIKIYMAIIPVTGKFVYHKEETRKTTEPANTLFHKA
jgi:copper homeostasis protein CutC